MVIFKVLSALLSYPSAEMRLALPEMAEIVKTSRLLDPLRRDDLLALIEELGDGDLLTVEERYVDLFDRGRALCLHLFEHLHGESRDRGEAMVELKQLYACAGFEMATRELPDYLPVVLEYLSCRDLAEARDMLADCGHILATIGRSLLARRSRYAAVVQALLVIGGQNPIDSDKVAAVDEPLENLDREWAEQPAFGDVSTYSAARAPTG
ncbi:MAG: nitrate reductase molybdenum cofactor assembly chaperone [Xanthobacteraceae bacterium]